MKNFRAALATAGAAFALALGMTASAQTATSNQQGPVSNPRGVVPNLSFAQVAPVLKEAGFTVATQAFNGETIMSASAGGRNLVFLERACSAPGNCAGLWVFAYMNDTASLESINKFNAVAKPARATLQNGKVVLDRYLIADYGTTRGSLVINVGVMASMINQWSEYSKTSGPIAVSFSPLIGPADGGQRAGHEVNEQLLIDIGRDASVYNSVRGDHLDRLN